MSASIFDGYQPVSVAPTKKVRRPRSSTQNADVTISPADRALAATLDDGYLLRRPREKGVRKEELLSLMKTRYPAENAEDQLRKARKAQALIRKTSRPKKQLSADEKTLLEWHRQKPNRMVKPEYISVLKDMRGVNTSGDIKHKNWLGAVPQTLEDAEYNSMAQDFAEMIGVAQMRPRYDKRLLTEPSARAAFGKRADDYTYTAEDMDNDPNTPATMIIRDKKHGNKIIAAGGYRIPNATPGQTEQLMKDMHYYSENPTAKLRSEKSRNVFMYVDKNDIYGKSRRVKTWTKITDFITTVLKRADITAPERKSPSYIVFRHPYKNQEGKLQWHYVTCFVLSPISWNGVIRNIAKLFAYYYIFPIIANGQHPTVSRAVSALVELCAHQTIEHQDIALDAGLPDNANAKLRHKMMYGWQNDVFIEPDLEASIMKDPTVRMYIIQVLNTFASSQQNVAYAFNVINNLLQTVCVHMARINPATIFRFPALADKFKGLDPLKRLEKFITAGFCEFTFVKNAEEETIEEVITRGLLPSAPLTIFGEDKYMTQGGAMYLGLDSKYVEAGYVPRRSRTSDNSGIVFGTPGQIPALTEVEAPVEQPAGVYDDSQEIFANRDDIVNSGAQSLGAEDAIISSSQ